VAGSSRKDYGSERDVLPWWWWWWCGDDDDDDSDDDDDDDDDDDGTLLESTEDQLFGQPLRLSVLFFTFNGSKKQTAKTEINKERKET
jgi:hypothetical protein